MSSYLSNGRLNVNILREYARKELLESLDKCHGKKAIVWDEQLIGPFGLVAEYALLQDHDVLKMFTIRSKWSHPATVQHIIFLTRPHLPLMDIIADYIKQCTANRDMQGKSFHIFFVPNKTLLCDKRLKDLGVYGSFIYVENLDVELYPYDSDVVSMELDSVYRECHLEDDMTSMYHVAQSLMLIQSLFGIIPHVYGAGKCAKHVYDLMIRMQLELAGNEPQLTSQIDSLILIDREVDLLTPQLTQVTYEGLIDEFFGINNTIVKLPPEKFLKANDETQELPTEPKPFVLNSGEELFAEIRDHNFSAATQIIIKKLKAYTVEFEESKRVSSVPEIKKVAAKIPKMQSTKLSLSNHMSIAELITDSYNTNEFLENVHIENEFLNIIDTDKPSPYIEECIAKQKPLLQVLRLMCIQSATNSGLKPKLLDYYKKEIIQSYGFQHILTLQNLESTGLLRVQEQKRPYTILRKNFQLTLDDAPKNTPNQTSCESSGYAPMSIRLVQQFSRSNWRAVSDLLRLLPGTCFEQTQQVPLGLRRRRGSGSSIQSSTDEQKLTLVFFLGGCTYSEISSLRYLSTQDEYPTEYVIGTTKIINGNTFIQSLMEKLESPQL